MARDIDGQRLASECQVLGTKLTKDLQASSGLGAVHRNSTQEMAHETLTLGCSAQDAGYHLVGRRL